VLSKSLSGEPIIIPFADRRQAGKQLATQLADYANRSDVVVLALPRGGVPVAFGVARVLRAPLDVFWCASLASQGTKN
jgi:putative phosphoribosyl transferase